MKQNKTQNQKTRALELKKLEGRIFLLLKSKMTKWLAIVRPKSSSHSS